MKTLATEKQTRLTYLKRELAKLATNAWWVFRDTLPNHPMVLKLTRRAEELTREIKELEEIAVLDKPK